MQPVIEGLMEFQWKIVVEEMKRVYSNIIISNYNKKYIWCSYTGALYGTMQWYSMVMK